VTTVVCTWSSQRPRAPWLDALRWIGVLIGAGLVAYGIGALVRGSEGVLVYTGATMYLVLLPIWGLLIGRYLRRLG
jgi:hypothetical protein